MAIVVAVGVAKGDPTECLPPTPAVADFAVGGTVLFNELYFSVAAGRGQLDADSLIFAWSVDPNLACQSPRPAGFCNDFPILHLIQRFGPDGTPIDAAPHNIPDLCQQDCWPTRYSSLASQREASVDYSNVQLSYGNQWCVDQRGPDLCPLPNDATTAHGTIAWSGFEVPTMLLPTRSLCEVEQCDLDAASIAHGSQMSLRLITTGDDADRDQIWFGVNTDPGSYPLLFTAGPDETVTVPCVSSGYRHPSAEPGAPDKFVGVWAVRGPLAIGDDAIYAVRFNGSVPDSVVVLESGLTIPGTPLFSPHSNPDSIVPPSVAMLNDGSFAVSYSRSSGPTNERVTRLYSADAVPVLIREVVIDEQGSNFHTVVATGNSMSDPNARVVAVLERYCSIGSSLEVIYRVLAPGLTACPRPTGFGPSFRVPTTAVGPSEDRYIAHTAFHPADIRPDGRLVVAWYANGPSGNQPHGTVREVFGTICPADVNDDGMLDIFDFTEFQDLFAQQDPRADFNCDNQFDILDFLEFQDWFTQGCY